MIFCQNGKNEMHQEFEILFFFRESVAIETTARQHEGDHLISQRVFFLFLSEHLIERQTSKMTVKAKIKSIISDQFKYLFYVTASNWMPKR